MNRRTYLTALGGALSIAAAGCGEAEPGEETVLDEVVIQDAIFTFDAAAGDELRVVVDNEQGIVASISINNRDTDTDVLQETVETEAEFTVTPETGGVHEAIVAGERVAVAVFRS